MNSNNDIKISEEYKDRVESQDELYNLLEKCFYGIDKMDFSCFSSVIEKVSSDIFLFVRLSFMLDLNFPFREKAFFEEYIRRV